MDRAGRIVAVVLLVLAGTGGLLAPWMPCTTRSASPAVRAAAALVYRFGHEVCNQRPDRSFASCGVPWPVCGRCAGLYLGAAFGALALLVIPAGTASTAGVSLRGWRRLLLGAALPTAVLWLLEHGAGIDPGTPLRFAGALPLGVVGALWLWAVSRGDLR